MKASLKTTKTHVQTLTQLHTSAFFFRSDGSDDYFNTFFNMIEDTNSLLKQLMEKMSELQEQVNTLQASQP